MSYTEFHTGRLYPVSLTGTLEETCKAIAKRHNIELDEDWEEDFRDKFSEYAYKHKRVTEEYFIHGNRLYRVIDHEESDSEEYFMKLSRNENGSLSFIGQFYNGGTCFSEMLEDALDELQPTYEEQIKYIVEELIATKGEDAPKTVPSAAKLIMKYHGVERARELFEGAARETKDNVFRSSAYEATLETILK
jgi:hypothetical protein